MPVLLRMMPVPVSPAAVPGLRLLHGAVAHRIDVAADHVGSRGSLEENVLDIVDRFSDIYLVRFRVDGCCEGGGHGKVRSFQVVC